MKKSELRLMIRQIVREEVALSIQEVITELKQPVEQVSQPRRNTIGEQKSFSSNSIINGVLNETAESDEWKTLGNGTYDSGNMNELMGAQYKDTTSNLASSMGVNPNNAPDFLTKDYSAVMKKIDEKTQQKRGG